MSRRGTGADSGRPATLVLIRHGSTDDTQQHRVRGGDGPGPELNDTGRDQIRRAGQLLAGWPELTAGIESPVTLVSSPVLRARQSAELLGVTLGLEPELDADWSEVSLGAWDGLGYAQIEAGWPAQYRTWLTSSSTAPPHGESLDDVGKRVAAARDRLVRDHPGRTAVVVSHTAPIRTVLSRALDAGSAALWRLRIDPASFSVVRYWGDGGCEVSAVNSTAALPLART